MPCSKNKRIRKDQLPARPITTKDLEMAAELAKDVFVQEDASQELVHSIAVLYTKIPEALERAPWNTSTQARKSSSPWKPGKSSWKLT